MTCNLLISWRQLWYVFLPNLKNKPDIFHFFAYDVPPKGIAIILMKCLFLLDWLGDLDAIFLRSNPILWPQLSNDAVTLSQHIPDPLCKWWFAWNTVLYRIFSHLYRIRVLHILEGHSRCALILPFYEDFKVLCCLSTTIFYGTRSDERVLLLYFRTIVPMVNDILEYDIPTPLFINWIWLSKLSPFGSWFFYCAKEYRGYGENIRFRKQ